MQGNGQPFVKQWDGKMAKDKLKGPLVNGICPNSKMHLFKLTNVFEEIKLVWLKFTG